MNPGQVILSLLNPFPFESFPFESKPFCISGQSAADVRMKHSSPVCRLLKVRSNETFPIVFSSPVRVAGCRTPDVRSTGRTERGYDAAPGDREPALVFPIYESLSAAHCAAGQCIEQHTARFAAPRREPLSVAPGRDRAGD